MGHWRYQRVNNKIARNEWEEGIKYWNLQDTAKAVFREYMAFSVYVKLKRNQVTDLTMYPDDTERKKLNQKLVGEKK